MAVNLEMNIQYESPNYQNVERTKKSSPLPARNAQYRGKDVIYSRKRILKGRATGNRKVFQ